MVSPRLIQPFILSRSIKWVLGSPGNLVVKSKLSYNSGFAALRQLNAIHKKGLKSFFKVFSLNIGTIKVKWEMIKKLIDLRGVYFCCIVLLYNNISPCCGIGRHKLFPSKTSLNYSLVFHPITATALSETHQSKTLFCQVIKNLHW